MKRLFFWDAFKGGNHRKNTAEERSVTPERSVQTPDSTTTTPSSHHSNSVRQTSPGFVIHSRQSSATALTHDNLVRHTRDATWYSVITVLMNRYLNDQTNVDLAQSNWSLLPMDCLLVPRDQDCNSSLEKLAATLFRGGALDVHGGRSPTVPGIDNRDRVRQDVCKENVSENTRGLDDSSSMFNVVGTGKKADPVDRLFFGMMVDWVCHKVKEWDNGLLTFYQKMYQQ